MKSLCEEIDNINKTRSSGRFEVSRIKLYILQLQKRYKREKKIAISTPRKENIIVVINHSHSWGGNRNLKFPSLMTLKSN